MTDISKNYNDFIKNKNMSEEYLMNGHIIILDNGDVVRTFNGEFLFNNADILYILYADYVTIVFLDITDNIVVYRKTEEEYENVMTIKNVQKIKYINIIRGWSCYVEYDDFKLLLHIRELALPFLPDGYNYKSKLAIYHLDHYNHFNKPLEFGSYIVHIEEKCLNKIIGGNVFEFINHFVVRLSDDLVYHEMSKSDIILSRLRTKELSITGAVYFSNGYVLYNKNDAIEYFNIKNDNKRISVKLGDLNYSDIKNIIVCGDKCDKIVILTEKKVFVFDPLGDKKKVLGTNYDLNEKGMNFIFYDLYMEKIIMSYFRNDYLYVASLDLSRSDGFEHKNTGIRKEKIKEKSACPIRHFV